MPIDEKITVKLNARWKRTKIIKIYSLFFICSRHFFYKGTPTLAWYFEILPRGNDECC